MKWEQCEYISEWWASGLWWRINADCCTVEDTYRSTFQA